MFYFLFFIEQIKINLFVYKVSGNWFVALIYFQLFSFLFVATQLCQLCLSTIGSLLKHRLLILSYWKPYSLLLFIPSKDRDHTDLRRINKFVIVKYFIFYFCSSYYSSDYVFTSASLLALVLDFRGRIIISEIFTC